MSSAVKNGIKALTKEAGAELRAFRAAGGGAGKEWTNTQKLDRLGGMFMGGLQDDALRNGSTVLGQMGKSAIRGAAWGGVIGGTASAAQGGSFWDGAKQGAFNGAVGWTAYRTAMRGVGATSLNPLAKQATRASNLTGAASGGAGGGGLFNATGTMWRTMSNDAEVSKQAISILNGRQNAAIARSFMNSNSKK